MISASSNSAHHRCSRRNKWRKLTTLAAGLVLWPLTVTSAEIDRCSDDAMLVFDGSGSMAEMGYNGLDHPRIFEAREAMQRAMPRITPLRRVGLIVYGPGPNEACNVDLRFPPQPDAASLIIEEIENLNPGGKTPLTLAVKEATKTLRRNDDSGVVVLVTDGKETCGGKTCQLANELSLGTSNITVHVIGFKVRGDFFSWDSQEQSNPAGSTAVARCLADQTGGEYFAAESTDDLVAALAYTLTCPLIGRYEPITRPLALSG